jgi:hypothetical protein
MPQASDTLGVKPTMSKTSDKQESDESNQIQRTHAMSVDAEVIFEDTCSRSLLNECDAALRLHNNLNLLEIVAEQDEAEATAGIGLTPTDARRLATKLLTMSTGGYIEDLDTERSNGCTRIRVSQSCTAYSYDDEADSIVAGEREMTVEEAEQLRDDLDCALEALSEEQARRIQTNDD